MRFLQELTIAIPVFERREFFENALSSILKQTVECQVLVVDNASSHDFFKEKCLEQGISYFRNETNIGVFPNWNRCFELARSEYVMILGDDDQLSENYVETFSECLDKYGQIDIFYTDFLLNYIARNKVEKHAIKLPFGYSDNGVKVLEYGILHGLGFPVISSVIRKSVFTNFYELEHGSNDWCWIYNNIKSLKIYGHNVPLLKYGSHSNQDSKNIDTHIKCMLSIAYIYDVVLANQVEEKNELFILAKQRARDNFNYFISILPNIKVKELTGSKLIYAQYFQKKLKEFHIYKVALLLPKGIRYFCYRVLRKLHLVGKV